MMNFSIKKYQKTSLTLMSIALFSASTLSQAQEEWTGSFISLCEKHAYLDYERLVSLGYYTWSEIETIENGLREDLKQQALVSMNSYNMGFNLGPRYLTDEASIINTNPNNPINISDRSEKLRSPGEFYVLSRLLIRSFDTDPNQVLTGKATVSGPGVHHLNEVTVRLGDLPSTPTGYKISCKQSSFYI